MNKAAKAKLLAEELRKAEPGIMTAFVAVAVMLSSAAVIVLTIYGLMAVIGPGKARDPLIGDLRYAPTALIASRATDGAPIRFAGV